MLVWGADSLGALLSAGLNKIPPLAQPGIQSLLVALNQHMPHEPCNRDRSVRAILGACSYAVFGRRNPRANIDTVLVPNSNIDCRFIVDYQWRVFAIC